MDPKTAKTGSPDNSESSRPQGQSKTPHVPEWKLRAFLQYELAFWDESGEAAPQVEEFLSEIPQDSREKTSAELASLDRNLKSLRSTFMEFLDANTKASQLENSSIRDAYWKLVKDCYVPEFHAQANSDITSLRLRVLTAKKNSLSGEIIRAYLQKCTQSRSIPDPEELRQACRESGFDERLLAAAASEHYSVWAWRFKLKRQISKGGQARVFVADDHERKCEVAIKLAHSNTAVRSRWRSEREPLITSQLTHPSIPSVFAVGSMKPPGQSTKSPFFAMEYVRGVDLQKKIDQYHEQHKWRRIDRRNRAFLDLLRNFLDVCRAVEYAHQCGVVHRDLKPRNIMVGQAGSTYVIDWGIAKLLDPQRDDLRLRKFNIRLPYEPTRLSDVLGTAEYMAPEQALGGFKPDAKRTEVGCHSDVFSLGAILFQMIAKRSWVRSVSPECAAEAFKNIANEDDSTQVEFREMLGLTEESSIDADKAGRESRSKHAQWCSRMLEQFRAAQSEKAIPEYAVIALTCLIGRARIPRPTPIRRRWRIFAVSVDRELQEICLKAMRRDPAGRYPTAQKLAERLERWRDNLIDPELESGWRNYLFGWKQHPYWTLLLLLIVIYLPLVVLGIIAWEEFGRSGGGNRTEWIRRLTDFFKLHR